MISCKRAQTKTASVEQLKRMLAAAEQLPTATVALSAAALPTSHPLARAAATECTTQGIAAAAGAPGLKSDLLRSPALTGVTMAAGVIAAAEACSSVYGFLRLRLPAEQRLAMDAAAGLAAAAALVALKYA